MDESSKENESADAHMAGFHEHIAPLSSDTANLENEIMGAVRMTDYDQLTSHYKKASKDIN